MAIGNDPANDPTGWYGFDMNPKLVNPERGFVYSANNAPNPTTAFTPATTMLETPGRRHFEALSAPKTIGPCGCRTIQLITTVRSTAKR